MAGCYRYNLYIATNNRKYVAGYSHDPCLDAKFLSLQGFDNFYLITRPLIIGQVIPLFQRVAHEGNKKGALMEDSVDQLLGKKIKALKSEARRLGIPPEAVLLKKLEEIPGGQLSGLKQAEILENVLRGRILFLHEIERLLSARKLRLAMEKEDALQLLCLQQKCIRLPGIRIENRNKFVCSRCGQSDRVVPIICASCGEKCYHCENCLSMGESRYCQSLYAVPGDWDTNRLPIADVKPKMFVTLSPAQENASNALRQFVLQPEQREKLVWAACGAGKTEVTFRAIAEALSRRQKVLFAIPRKDAVEEIVVRIRRAFPKFRVACIHGTSTERFAEAAVVVATTHQVLRFYSSFGLVILDEIDAYPYNISPMLQFGVMRARAKGGKIIYMTATPSEDLLSRHKKKELPLVWIPARYHGYPLPQPGIVIEKRLALLERGNTIPERIIDIIHETLEGDLAQLFVFVPSIETGKRVAQVLHRAVRLPPFNDFEGQWVEFLHSRDEDREGKLAAFRKGKFPILVTTTICERGLTLPKVNVLVLFADYSRIFNASALIQMAGRSGRTMEDPGGKVWFAASRYSLEMKIACERIKRMNLQAWEMGYLRPETTFILDRKGSR